MNEMDNEFMSLLLLLLLLWIETVDRIPSLMRTYI